MILIDTNVFLEAFLKQTRALECRRLLDAVAERKVEATVTHFTIHGVEAVLARGERLLNFLRSVEASQGLSIYDSTSTDEVSVAILSQKIERDFDDALQYYVAKKIHAEAIVSFDKHFEGLDVPRVEPASVLSKIQ